jgi:DNA polymerase
MHGNQWKLASLQLLNHWRRCGVAYVPQSRELACESPREWLQSHGIWDSQELAGLVAEHRSEAISNVQVEEQRQISAAGSALGDSSSAAGIRTPTSPIVASTPAAPNPSTPSQVSSPARVIGPAETGKWLTAPLEDPARQAAFAALNDSVAACRKCEDIVCRRQRTVFGVGPVNAKLVMFGEAPGADEDRVGEPFVGAAGQLLDKILIASGLKRDQVYIMNALKCRPPNNRTPSDDEIENCRPNFEAQLETIQPDYIVCWGAIAVRAVLKSTDSVGRLRGRFHSFRGAKVLVTYHPAYLLRNPAAKRLTWEDMKLLMREIGIPVPG